MATNRIYAIRPYGRRYAAAQEPSYSGALESGEKFGKMLAGGIGQAIQQSKQNAVANQLLNQGNWMAPPRAGLVAPGVNPQTGQANVIAPGVSPIGTKPATGGVEELNMRISEAKARQQLAGEQFNLSNAAAKQRLLEQAYSGRGGGGRSPWSQQGRPDASKYIQSQQGGGQGGKAKKYAPGSSTPNDPDYYNYNNQRADVDARYGKGTFDRMLALQGVIVQDPKTGKWTSTSPDVANVNADTGDVTLMGAGGKPGVHIPADELTVNMKRYDATTVQKGGKPQYIGNYMKSQAPETGKDAGAIENPYLPKDTVDLNAIPPGQYFVNPADGKVHQKQPSQGGTADTSTPADTSTKDTSTVTSTDTSTDTSSDEDLSQAGGERGGAQLASNVPSQPNMPPVDFGQGDQAGRPLDPELAEALRRKQVASSLMA